MNKPSKTNVRKFVRFNNRTFECGKYTVYIRPSTSCSPILEYFVGSINYLFITVNGYPVINSYDFMGMGREATDFYR